LSEELARHHARHHDRCDRGDVRSSHWRHFEKFIKLPANKQPVGFTPKGLGFGGIRFSSPAHRVIDWLCIASYLVHMPAAASVRRMIGRTRPLRRRMGVDLTLDVFRQVCTLALLGTQLMKTAVTAPRVLMIGDGFGVLSALFKEIFPHAAIVLVDLPLVLAVQAHYCQKAFAKSSHRLAGGGGGAVPSDFLYCPADSLDRIASLRFDLAVNIASMQEMTSPMIARYFDLLRRQMVADNLFYCCNREKKTMAGGETSAFFNYPWHPCDRHVIEGLCPWHRYFFAFSQTDNAPRLAGIPVPLVRFYDGRHVHRLSCLWTATSP
jgi:hypothetical protein